ncbi:MAG: hypothetical protein JWQ85_2668 [Mucilaginibacter sp.]|nr:hypothetical protein [Mucilaginibacter sp.]
MGYCTQFVTIKPALLQDNFKRLLQIINVHTVLKDLGKFAAYT